MFLYSSTHSTILLKLIVAVSDPLLFIRPLSIVLVHNHETFSGPRRYEWHKFDGDGSGAKSQQWSYTRAGSDRATLLHVLREEILSITGIDVHKSC